MKTIKYAIIYDNYFKEYSAYRYSLIYRIFGESPWEVCFHHKDIDELKINIKKYHDDYNRRTTEKRYEFVEIFEVK